MNSLELTINDSVIELAEETRIGLTFQRNTLSELEKRQGNTSNQFKVRKTKKNQITFGFADNVNSATIFPYRKLTSKVRQSGIEVIPEGVATIESADNFYNIIVNSGVTSFFDLIGEKKLAELDLSASDHIWNIANVKDTTRSDWRYLLIDWGSDFDLADLNSDRLLPIMFAKYLLEKICSEINYTAVGSFIDSQQYPRLMYTPDTIKLSDTFIEENKVDSKITVNTTTFIHDISNGFAYTTDFPMQVASKPTMSTTIATFTPTVDIWGELSISSLMELYLFSLDPLSSFEVYYSIDIFDETLPGLVYTSPNTQLDFSGYVTLQESVFESTGLKLFKAGHQYHLRINFTKNVAEAEGTLNYNFKSGTIFYFTPHENIKYNTTIPIAQMYQQTQKNFIKDIIKEYCINLDVNEVTRVIRFDFFDDLTDNIPKAKNWSEKIDLSVQPSLSYSYGDYGQTNNLKYKENEFVKPGYGDSSFAVDNERLELVKDVVSINASATELSLTKLAGQDVPKIKAIAYADYAWTNPNNRFLLLDSLTGFAVTYIDSLDYSIHGKAVDVPFCYFKKDGKTDNLDFDNLILNHYGTIIGILYNCKFYECNGTLSAVDIANLDFNIPIYLNIQEDEFKVNGYFYLNKVDNWNGKNSTALQLIRL